MNCEDDIATTELKLFIENDGDLYRQQGHPIIKNLTAKKARGVYDHTKAVKLYGYLVANGIKKYDRDFGAGSMRLSSSDKRCVAEMLTHDFEVEYRTGGYKHLLPKKYQ
jgi:hypothetical protein